MDVSELPEFDPLAPEPAPLERVVLLVPLVSDAPDVPDVPAFAPEAPELVPALVLPEAEPVPDVVDVSVRLALGVVLEPLVDVRLVSDVPVLLRVLSREQAVANAETAASNATAQILLRLDFMVITGLAPRTNPAAGSADSRRVFGSMVPLRRAECRHRFPSVHAGTRRVAPPSDGPCPRPDDRTACRAFTDTR